MSEGKVIILPDSHVPFEDKKAYGAVLNYMADEQWTECVQLGDFLDINSVSAHNKGKPKLVEGERLSKDYEYANGLLDDITQALRVKNKKAKLTMLKGNHEWRVDRYVEEHPALEGLIETHIGLKLKERGVKYVECYPKGELHKIGRAYFTHGMWCGGNHAKKHADHYGVSILYGHTHDVQLHSKVLHGKNKTVMGLSLGCLCDYDAPYLEGRPTAWQHAIGVMHVQANGFFNVFPTLIFNGEFVAPSGKKYSYKEKFKPKRKR